jgi:hypothetical protein
MMNDILQVRLNAHRNNIQRYRRLLQTRLTDLERGYIVRRLQEEERALAQLRSPVGASLAARPAGGGQLVAGLS